MPSQQDEMKKDEIIQRWMEARAHLISELEAVPPERRDVVFLGTWSVRDLLAHLIGWLHTNNEAVTDLLAARLPAFYARFNPDWSAYNAELVARYKQDDFRAMVEQFNQAFDRLLERLRALPAGEIEKDRGVRSGSRVITIDRMLEAEIDDEVKHADQIHAWRTKAANAA